MLSFKFLLYFPLLLATASADGDPSIPIFTAIAPKIIYPHSQYNLSIFIEPSAGNKGTPLELSAEINSTTGILAQADISLLPGQNQVLPIQIKELSLPSGPESGNKLTLKIKCKTLNCTERAVQIYPNKKEVSILIQSDKSIYKPGEMVKFRVILLDRSLKPLIKDQLAEIRINDVSSNLIKKWDDLTIHSGFYKDQLQLASEPLLGDWNIEVKLKNNGGSEERQNIQTIQKTLYFSIEEYVLPKYEVSVQLPKFLTFQDLNVPVRVEAKYTYGKPVEGNCTLRVRRKTFYYDMDDKAISKSFPVSGTGLIDVNIKELFNDWNRNEQTISFEANVTEEVTGKTLQASSSVRIYKFPYKIQRLSQTESLMPGLPYTATFKVSTQDDVPIPDPAPDALKVSHSFAYDKEEATFNSSIPETGLVFMKFRVPTNTLLRPSSIEITYKELTERFSLPSFNTDSKVFFQIQLLPSWYKANTSVFTDVPVNDPVYKVNSKLRVNVNATEPFKTLNYLIHRGQNLLASEQVHLAEPKKEYDLEIRCPENAEPGARIVVYMVVNGTEEILAKSLKFKAVRGEGRSDDTNFLNVTLSEAKLEPGEKITLKLQSTKGSLVALRGVDQSVLLLKGDKDITEKTLEDEASNQEKFSIPYSSNWDKSESFLAFDEGGLVILTNGNLTKRSQDFVPIALESVGISGGMSMAMPGLPAPMPGSPPMPPGGGMMGPSGGGSQQIRTRKDFPESWLWEEVALNESSNFDLVKTVPDTITSWIISGYSLNPSTGVGILAPMQKFTTFRPFFISLDLPYSVVKGEVLLLKVLVHNYLPDETEVTADITIKNENADFEFAGLESSQKEQTIPISLKPNSVTAIKIAIIPQVMGLIMLNVLGKTRTAGDALIQPLRVIPPGSIQRGSTAVLLDPSIQANGTLNAVLPEKRVKGADKLKLTLISNILGTTISNLDKLLVLPTGCGEQNMMGFTVDTVLLNYFNSSKTKVDTSITAKATSYLETGYQRQLKYKHFDGSYSIWAGDDNPGSTWLTAFVIRSFIQARKFVTIDENLIEKGLKFLGVQQNSDGGINENAGGSQHSLGESRSSVVPLSAFTLLTFLEAQKNWEPDNKHGESESSAFVLTMEMAIEKTLEFITSKALNPNFDDMFGLILTTYAATLADHPEKDALFEKVKSLARIEKGMTYWDSEKKGYEYYSKYTSPLSVEMTSYVLLTYMAQGQTGDALPVVRWLLNQRSASGGFLSTQDTIMGLWALAEFDLQTNTKDVDLQVVYKEDGSEKSVDVNQQNKDVLQEFELASTTRTVDVATRGKGSVLAQLSWTYYVEDADKSPAFVVEANATETPSKDLSLRICTRYLTGKNSSMTIIEVNLPSGYGFDADSLGELKNEVRYYKRHEVENRNTKLVIYVEKVSWFNTCFGVYANKLFKVGKLEPSYVSVYDYYDTTKSGRAFYQPPEVSFCDICKESRVCNEKTCL